MKRTRTAFGSTRGAARKEEEPRTGVVRKIHPRSHSHGEWRCLEAPGGAPSEHRSAPPSERRVAALPERRAGAYRIAMRAAAGAPSERAAEPARRPAAAPEDELSIAQLSRSGAVVRHTGEASWLPDAGEFVYRLASLVATDLGFERCKAVVLRGPATALSVAEAGSSQIMCVVGPRRRLGHLLRRVGLE